MTVIMRMMVSCVLMLIEQLMVKLATESFGQASHVKATQCPTMHTAEHAPRIIML